MLRGYNNMKERLVEDTDQGTRSINNFGVETMSESILVKLPNADSIKRTIRLLNPAQMLPKSKFWKDLKLSQKVNHFYYTIPDLEILIE